MPRVAAIAGDSGSGKTTRLVQAIERLVARGQRVAAIKHTHHDLNEENRGDTARFRAAGASPVILAGNGEAVIFDTTSTRRVAYAEPGDLVALCDTDVVLIEGFKNVTRWPSIDELLANVSS